MKIGKYALGLLLILGGSPVLADGPTLSGPVVLGEGPTDPGGLKMGIVADAQLQTRANYALVRGYRGKIEDWAIPVSIRPPALDWAARSILRTHLDQLKAGGAEAIFFLGDGANNGCHDELAAGLDLPLQARRNGVRTNDLGVLALLDTFRQEAGIPVYFAIGNHDILGAGSTSKGKRRAAFCADANGKNRALTKLDVIRITDRFNRGNEGLGSKWSYASSYSEGSGATSLDTLCGRARRQHRRWGCYLAARVDYQSAQGPVQFLLLDTNDWVNVSESSILGWDQEGLRGAMSFGEDRLGVASQTKWFERNASGPVSMRVALTHYDVTGLMKNIQGFALSSRSQQFMNLFITPQAPRKAVQNGAYVISGHTHNPEFVVAPRVFNVACGLLNCQPGNTFSVTELNVGSTTDSSNYSGLVRLLPSTNGPGSVYYSKVRTPEGACEAVAKDIEAKRFPNAFNGEQTGWKALGIDPDRIAWYRDFTFEQMQPMWANLDAYAGADATKANCIGLYAAELERRAR
jgi:predicted phosphodiesterase